MTRMHNLDTSGIIVSPGAMVKRIMENFMVSDNSQTFFYIGEVSSLRHIFSNFDNDIENLRVSIINALERMYGRYFDSVDAFVNAELNEDGVSVDIDMSVSVTNDGIPYTLSESVNTKDVLALYNSK